MILSTSDIDIHHKAAKTAFAYLLISLFCALFGAVYEMYSHGVYSFYMIYAFAFPLAGGTLPFSVFSLLRNPKYPGAVSKNLYHSGIAAVTVGSILRGILDIYGTTNQLAGLYFYVGGILIIIGVVIYYLNLMFSN